MKIIIINKQRFTFDDDFTHAYRLKVNQGYAYMCLYIKQVKGHKTRKDIPLHRMIMGAKPGEFVDHINRDITDNRRSNLRITNAADSVLNRGCRRGCRMSKSGKWYSRVTYRGVHHQIGPCSSREEVIAARNAKAAELSPMFAMFPV